MTINIGIHIKNYKSFKANGASIADIRPINVVIGKNNIGKSSFLDSIQALIQRSHDDPALAHTELKVQVPDSYLKSIFPENTSGGDLGGNHWRDHGELLTGLGLIIKVDGSGFKLLEAIPASERAPTSTELKYISSGLQRFDIGVAQLRFIKLSAERDISPEKDDGGPFLDSNGRGATRLIHQFIHHSTRDRSVITVRLLKALNTIFEPDIRFSEITTKFHEQAGQWEVYLAEDNGELFALSKSGSGLKTIILTLLNLLVIPVVESKSSSLYVYAFEELENNLHPSLQRNLFLYLEKFAESNNCHMFITTHSSIAIDAFSGSNSAQILHIGRGDNQSVGTVYTSTSHGYSILEDLGVRASDILQANGLLWVEGPSDRVFLNKFINIWSEGTLREGAHYQFAFYGGSVLANLNTEIPEDKFQDALSVFRINRNFIFACDSDRKAATGPLKHRVKELTTSLDGYGGLYWVTKCKEIENYIPREAFEAVHAAKGLTQIGEYEYIQDYLKSNKLSNASEYRDKHQKAALYSEHFTRDNLAFRAELDEVITRICNRIKQWNHL